MAGPLGDDVVGRFETFQNTDIDATAEQLTATSYPATRGVLLYAPSTNSGSVFVGNSSAVLTTTGIRIEAGKSLLVKVNNANLIFVIGSAANQALDVLVV